MNKIKSMQFSSSFLLDVPISVNKDNRNGGFLSPDTDAKYEKFSDEVGQWYIGPIPAKEFLLAFVPPGCNETKAPDYALLKALFSKDSGQNKQEFLKSLCNYFNSSGLCPNFRLAEPTEYFCGSKFFKFSTPDLCLYSSNLGNDLGEGASILGSAELFVQVKVDEFREDPFRDPVSEPDLSCPVFIRDLFEELDDEGEGEDENDEDEDEETEVEDTYTRNRGEIAICAAELCARQFRTHCFSISIYGTKARLFRWDRAGVVISESFDILENPDILCHFMRQYANASDAQRGYDTTIAGASKEEEEHFVEVVRKHIKEQLSVESSELDALVKEHYEPGSVFKMPINPHHFRDLRALEKHVNPSGLDEAVPGPYPWDELWYETNKPDIESTSAQSSGNTTSIPTISKSRAYSKVQYFLVSRPVASPLKPICRGTRGYWAVKLPDESIGETEHHIAFVKDTWREVSGDTDIEGEVAIENVESGVKFVSDVYCHGDVRETDNSVTETDRDRPSLEDCHITQTGKYAGSRWNCNKANISSLRHYRMASVEVGYPLSSLRGTKELVHGIRCGFLAAWAAYVLRRRLHRDISLNNIILVNKGREWRSGILIDWELSSIVGKDGKVKDSARSGTWAFMSVALLRARDFKHRFQDDMESFYYVLLYSSLLWLPRQEVKQFEELLSEFFDEYKESKGTARGGTFKIANIVTGLFRNLWQFDNMLVQNCLDEVLELQRPFEEQPSWTPQALYAIIKKMDEENLPFDDRMDHRRLKQNRLIQRKGRRAQRLECNPIPLKTDSVSHPTESAQTSEIKAETSSKRGADEAGLKERVEITKRPCCVPVDGHKEQGRSCECF